MKNETTKIKNGQGIPQPLHILKNSILDGFLNYFAEIILTILPPDPLTDFIIGNSTFMGPAVILLSTDHETYLGEQMRTGKSIP